MLLYIGAMVLFNGIILGHFISLGSNFIALFGVIKVIELDVAILIGYIISALFTIIGYTKFSSMIIRVVVSSRKATKRELDKIIPLLDEVISQVNEQYNTNYKLEKLVIKCNDSLVINAQALGYNTLIVNRGALDNLTDGQLKALFAHEIAHLYFRDSVKTIAIFFGSIANILAMMIYVVYMFIAKYIEELGQFGGRLVAGIITLVFMFLPMILWFPIILLYGGGIYIFNKLNMLVSRKAEFRADNFSASLGYKKEMIEVLEVLSNTNITDNSFLARLMATHPAPMLRIDKLEVEELQPQPIKSGDNNTKEIIVLTIYFLLIGLLYGILFLKPEYLNSIIVSNKTHISTQSKHV